MPVGASSAGVAPSPLALRARQIVVAFSGVRALELVDVDVTKGQILGLIGPNGAGKTTLINVISGLQKPVHGVLQLGQRDITATAASERALLGIARTFQSVRPFAQLTVRENIEVAALCAGFDHTAAQARATYVLDQLELAASANTHAASLPFGALRWLGIARAIVGKPDFLLLDEPAAGSNEDESEELRTRIADIRDELGCGILLVEHDMSVVMSLCDRVQVLDYGKTIAIGTPAEVSRDPAVMTAYLG